MNMELERFIIAQEQSYQTALQEIKNGKKQSHWMWFIFPQIKGLGISSMAAYYAIQTKGEAEAYLAHPVLGQRMREICQVLLKHRGCDVKTIFDYPDDLKLRSSMTLFYTVSENKLFQDVIDAFFDGELDPRTISILNQ